MTDDIEIKDKAAWDAAEKVADYEHGWSSAIEQDFAGAAGAVGGDGGAAAGQRLHRRQFVGLREPCWAAAIVGVASVGRNEGAVKSSRGRGWTR